MDDREVPTGGEPTVAMPDGSPRGGAESSGDTLPTSEAMAQKRYVLGEVLGEGGMGIVHEARDRQLKRTVAIKILVGDDRASVDRFLREARAQARVEHPNVCKVYEVGRLGGRPYIAMQRIRGVSSSAAARDMTVEQKAKVMRHVADAIQAAHAVGLVHRDIKPTNILIERTEDGDFVPYVTDFGIARDPQAPGLTTRGEALGSPAYMAPEQALGDVERMDRRTDVYGLGATLFELLTGRPPFEGRTALEVMQKVVDQEPPGVTTLRPGLPSDLATIVHKCLDKEPARRYPSASSLARDLDRFLAGEPVEAQRTSLLSRVKRRVRKHRVASALLAVAAFVIVLLAARLVAGARAAAEREEYARRFGQEAERLEGTLRIAALMPLHDTQAERGAVRRAVAEILTSLPRLPSGGRAAARFAAGRGLLALGEPAEALPHLQAAWEEGARRPEVAFALGRALSFVFQKELLASRRIGDPKKREARVSEIRRLYRDRALDFLGRSRALPSAAPEYVLGMIAFQEGRLPQAAELARRAFEKVPSLYEAERLEGDVRGVAGFEAHVHGKVDEARSEYAAALAAYRKAAEIARSDPRILDALCRVELRFHELATGDEAERTYDRVVSACRAAAAADSGFASPWSTMSLAAWKRGQNLRNAGRDPMDAYAASVAFADEALRRDPKDMRADTWAGVALTYRAEVESERGQDPRPTREAALARYRRAVAIDPQWPVTYNAIATILLDSGKDEAARGEDPTESLQEAEKSALDAFELDPTYPHAIAVAGLSRLHLGRYLAGRGLDPSALWDGAEEAFQKSVAIRANDAPFQLNLVDVRLDRAERALAAGGDARELLSEARVHLEAAAKADATNSYIPLARTRLARLAASAVRPVAKAARGRS